MDPDNVLGDRQRSLVNRLRALGFTVLQERHDPEAFGNYLIDLTTDDFTVRIVRDRSNWSIEASVPAWKDWIPVPMWRWIYVGGELPGAYSDFDQDAEWLLSQLNTLRADLAKDPGGLSERLQECGRLRLRALLERSNGSSSEPSS
jgi:hypothetical protein